jgi:hypothetical protein
MKTIAFIKNKIADAANFMAEDNMLGENELITLATLMILVPIMIAIL